MFYSNFVPKSTVFEIFDLQAYIDHETRVRGHSRSSERTPAIRHLWLQINVLWQLWAYMLYRLRDKRQFQSKVAHFSNPLFFKFFQHADNQFQGDRTRMLGRKDQACGFPLELGIGAWGQKTRVMALPGRKRCLYDIFSHLDTTHERGRQTDIHRMTTKTALIHSIAQ